MDNRFKGLSVFKATYLGNDFVVPIYPWEALSPFWEQIALAITKVLVYHRFSSSCYRDHNLWRQNRMGVEALLFADLLSRDLGMRKAVVDFNKQAPSLKYGEWMEPFYQDTPQFWDHLAQLGQLIWNSVRFLLKTGYLEVHKLELGVEAMRPYWSPISDLSLRRMWMLQTFQWMKKHEEHFRKIPNMEQICSDWKIPRYTLIEMGFTRETLLASYRHWKEKETIKVIALKKEFKLITPDDQKKIVENIAKRIIRPREV